MRNNRIMNTIIMPDILINEEYLAAYSELPVNYNYQEILPYIKTSELIWIEPVLGTPLYEELLQQVKDNSLTQVNSTLILEIYQYLSKAILFESLPFISYRMNEIGITKGKSDNADSIELKDVNYISNHLRSQLEYRKNYLIKWLERHKEYYPLYRGNNNNECEKEFLNKPNPHFQVYSFDKKKIDLE